MKKRFVSVFALLMALFLLAGCQSTRFGGQSGSSDAEKINMTYFGYKADTTNLLAIEDAIQSFQTKFPDVNINYEGIKGSSYYEKLDLRAQTGNLDDMFMVDHDSSVKLIKEGLLEDLSDIIDPSKFVPAAASQFVNEDGSIYFIPTAVISFGLYCNMDLLRENGFQEAPTTFGEFKQMCDYFVAKGITPIVANNYTTVRTLVLGKGMYDVYQQKDHAAIIEKLNTGELDIVEQLRPGVELVWQMVQDGWIDGAEAAETKPTSGDLELFKAGGRPFMFTGAWASPRVAGEGGVDFEYAIYPYPIMDNGSVLVMDIATCMSVNAKGEHKQIAKEFVKHMTEPDIIWAYCDSQSSFTPVLSDDRLPADKALQPQIAYLSNGQNVISSNFNITLPLNNALESCGLAIMGGCTLDEALAVLGEQLAG